jgi:hypothetical protein
VENDISATEVCQTADIEDNSMTEEITMDEACAASVPDQNKSSILPARNKSRKCCFLLPTVIFLVLFSKVLGAPTTDQRIAQLEQKVNKLNAILKGNYEVVKLKQEIVIVETAAKDRESGMCKRLVSKNIVEDANHMFYDVAQCKYYSVILKYVLMII